MTLRRETKARARAVQLLYAWELQHRPPLGAVAWACMAQNDGAGWRAGYELAAAVIEVVDHLDQAIGRAAENWRLERIGAVERCILRLGVYELEGRLPAAIAIDEAVRLARWFAGPKAPAFVNGVLDAVAHQSGRL